MDAVEHPTHVRQLYAELSLVSDGSCMNWNASGGGGSERVRPPGEMWPLQDQFLADWRSSGEPAVTKWRGILESTKRLVSSVPKGESEAQRAKRIVKDGEGWTVAEVAMALGVAPSEVKRARLRSGRFVGDGRLLPNGAPSQRLAAKSLRDSGLKQSQIARQLGLSQPTVSRLLAEKAA